MDVLVSIQLQHPFDQANQLKLIMLVSSGHAHQLLEVFKTQSDLS